jgi:hypothetical protein
VYLSAGTFRPKKFVTLSETYCKDLGFKTATQTGVLCCLFLQEMSRLEDFCGRKCGEHLMSLLERMRKRPQIIPGMTLPTLLRVLARNGFRVDTPCLGRLAHLTVLAVLNSMYATCEEFFDAREIESVEIREAPLFVIGHWRSGTTHLHNLLSLDENLTCPTAYQASFPSHFIFSQAGSPIFDLIAPKKRPMDNMAFSSSTPHEDEFALAAHSTVSPYMRILFPVTGDNGFTEFDCKKMTSRNLEQWKASLILFLKKLTLSEGGRITLKSPPHLGRVATLLELFPEAQFVHIMRDPCMVYLSTHKLWRDSLAHAHLQVPSPELVDELILSWYKELFALYFRDRDKIPAGQLHELKFEDLEAAPLETLKGMYDTLQLPGFEKLAPRITTYLDSIRGYRKNKFQVSDAVQDKVRANWSEIYKEYGYRV